MPDSLLNQAYYVTGEVSVDGPFRTDASTGMKYKTFAIDWAAVNGARPFETPPAHALIAYVPAKLNPGGNADVFAITEWGNDQTHMWGVVSRLDGKEWGVPLRIGFTALVPRPTR